jgi:hypothetical protein
MQNLELCAGDLDDYRYITLRRSGCYKRAEADGTSEESLPSIFSGRHCTYSSAARKQWQNCLQPEFANSDEHFRRHQTLHSVCVVEIRYVNERAIKRWPEETHG